MVSTMPGGLGDDLPCIEIDMPLPDLFPAHTSAPSLLASLVPLDRDGTNEQDSSYPFTPVLCCTPA